MYQFFIFQTYSYPVMYPVLNISRKAIRNPFVNDSLIYKEGHSVNSIKLVN